MAAFELPLVALVTVVLARLALLGRGRDPPSWTGLFAPGAIAWMAGAQGLLFRRDPDYMVAYLFEARRAVWPAYLAWCALALSLAWGFSVWAQRAGRTARWELPLVIAVAFVVGLLAVPLSGRLGLIGSTLEFRRESPAPWLLNQPRELSWCSPRSVHSFRWLAPDCWLRRMAYEPRCEDVAGRTRGPFAKRGGSR